MPSYEIKYTTAFSQGKDTSHIPLILLPVLESTVAEFIDLSPDWGIKSTSA